MSIYVSDLNIYPLKSGAGTRVESANVTRTGFEGDRLAMLVHAEGANAGKFITQRDRGCEKLSRLFSYVTRSIDNYANCIFDTPEGNIWNARLSLHDDQIIDTKVFASDCKGYNVGDPEGFLSAYMGFPVNLVLYASHTPRVVDAAYGRKGDIVSYADGMPFLITSEPSLHSLQEQLPQDVVIGMDRFRPNIVIDGNLPWEEDVMHHIRIGQVELEIVKPCARCVMTTIDQETGTRGESNEPISTLTKTRRGKGDGLQGVFFGQNAVPRMLGEICVGDEVRVLSTRPLHKALAETPLRYGL